MKWNRLLGAAALALPAAAFAADAPPKAQLAAPVQIQAEGGPIDTEVGHAAPYFADLDGDGKRDLLVGQFGGGKLRVYANAGDAKKPSFGNFTWFKAGADLGVVPSG